MIETARRFNRHGERCQYHVNTANDLRLFPDRRFDFIYSVIVLQHMPAPLSRNYVTEFVRVLAPGGLAVFQVPAQLVPARAAEINGRHEIFEFPDVSPTGPLRMEMHGIPRDEVERLVHDAGGRLVKALADTWAGPQWESYLYVVTK
jgi:ubiquinone/menaquinone biosynthesis C-methylase UbiE